MNYENNNLDNLNNNMDNENNTINNNLDNLNNNMDNENNTINNIVNENTDLNNITYNEDNILKQVLENSLKTAEDEYIALQIEKINNIEKQELLKQEILEKNNKELLIQEILEKKAKSLEKIIYQLEKLKKIEKNFSTNLFLLQDIIKKYINCEFETYYISLEIYNNIFNDLKNIRVVENELNIIKNILMINFS